MPIKWTPEIDQILLLKILETSDVSPKCPEIAEKWPANLERPTPRAISERIFKIRAAAKASGTTGHFSITAGKSNPSTPRKSASNGVTKKTTPKKTNGAKAEAGKRKRGGNMSEEEAADDSEAGVFKSDNNGTDASDDDETPKKKTKANSVPKGKGKGKDKDLVKVKNEEEENGPFNSSGSEILYGGDHATDFVDYA